MSLKKPKVKYSCCKRKRHWHEVVATLGYSYIDITVKKNKRKLKRWIRHGKRYITDTKTFSAELMKTLDSHLRDIASSRASHP